MKDAREPRLWPDRVDPEAPSARLAGDMICRIERLEGKGRDALAGRGETGTDVTPREECNYWMGLIAGYDYLAQFLPLLPAHRERVAAAADTARQRLQIALRKGAA